MSSHYVKTATKLGQMLYTKTRDCGSNETDQITDTSKPSENGSTHFNAMPVMIRGVLYQSHKEAAAALGISPSAISQRLKKTGSTDTVGLGVSAGMYGNTNRAIPITILGCEFPSRTIAAEELGITRSQLTKWISPKASHAQREMLMLSVMKYKQKHAKK
jgi:hypothetical protein